MGNVFDDSLEWSANDIKLTEQLVASADKQLNAPSKAREQSSIAELRTEPLGQYVTPNVYRLAAASLGEIASGGVTDVISHVTSKRKQHSLPATTECLPTAAAGNVPAAEARQQVHVPDLEDIGLVQDRRRLRPQGFSVTDFTAAQWCQQRFALELTARLPEVSICSASFLCHHAAFFGTAKSHERMHMCLPRSKSASMRLCYF
jgi:hypothetical protein